MKVYNHLLILLVLLFTCSCDFQNGNDKGPLNVEESTAYFDYFNYKGEDKYYEEHALASASHFYNPILSGWYSDPSICTNGEDYFLVTSTFVYYPGVPIFHSKDLVNWTQIGHVLDRMSQLDNFDGQGTSGGIFAPAIEYNPHNETYYMITTNVGAGNFFVKTKDPFGSWSDPVYLPEVGGIDPSFFFDDDGRAYIVNNDEPDGGSIYDGNRAIRICEFDVETEKVISESKMIVNGGVNLAEKPIWIEGPHLYKIDGRYLLMAAEGGTGPAHSEVVFSSNSPQGPFIPWDKNPILTQRHLDNNRIDPITCVGHADLVQTKEGDWWAVFLGCRPINGTFENLGRETFIMPVRWSEDGFPYMTRGDEIVPMIVERDGVTRRDNKLSGNFEKNDDFTGENLHYEWLTLRSPARDLYSLTKNPGFLTLKCSEVTTTERGTPALVARRLQHHVFESETKIYFEPTKASEAAGMLLYKDEEHQYFLSIRKFDDGRKISLEKVEGENFSVVASRETTNTQDPIYLKIMSRGVEFKFSFSLNKSDWITVADQIDASHLSSQNAGGFTGTTIGMYAVK